MSSLKHTITLSKLIVIPSNIIDYITILFDVNNSKQV